MTALLAWFGSSVGKVVAKWGALLALAATVYWHIYESGRAAEKADEIKRENEARKKVDEVDEKVSSMDDDSARRELERWVRHD